jgi:mannose-1-phosphate guanylyltransferase
VLATRPEIGYGYLQLEESTTDSESIRRVIRFTEKPELEAAQRFVSSDNYLWNAGIFVFRGRVLLDRLAQHQPVLAAGLSEMAANPSQLREIYSKLPAISIDHGLMEKLGDLGTVPLDCGWTDLGSWEAMWEQLGPDSEGNVISGEVIAFDTSDSLLMSTDGVVAAIGVEGLVVVKTGDAVLVVSKERSQEVRRIVEHLTAADGDDLL